jgi:hypothetical protein
MITRKVSTIIGLNAIAIFITVFVSACPILEPPEGTLVSGTVVTALSDSSGSFDHSKEYKPKEVRIYSITGIILAIAPVVPNEASVTDTPGIYSTYNWSASIYAQREQELQIYVILSKINALNDRTDYFFQFVGDSKISGSASTPNQFDINVKEIENIFIPIFSEQDLSAIGTTDIYPASGNYKLMNSIYLTADPWIPICSGAGANSPPFTGTFDGQGKFITDLKFDGTSLRNVGLFGVLVQPTPATRSIIKNLNIELADSVIPTSAVTNNIGAVVGNLDGGNIENVTVLSKGSKGLSVMQTGISAANINVGGIAGRTNVSTITKCSAQIAVKVNAKTTAKLNVGGVTGAIESGGGISNCYTTYTVSAENSEGGIYCGGIAGISSSTQAGITYCYAMGDILASPKAASGSTCGGILGNNNNTAAKISNCVYTNAIIGTNTATTITYNRILGGSSASGLTNNFAADNKAPPTGTATDQNGKGTASTAMIEAWWKSSSNAPGFSFWSATDDSNAWDWDAVNMRPKLH